MSDLPRQPTARVIRAAEADAWRDGFALLEAARLMLAEQQAITEAARTLAYEVGLAEGRRAAEREAVGQLAELKSRVQAYLAGLEPALADLAVGTAQQVVADWPFADRLRGATRRALTAFHDEQELVLYLARESFTPAIAEALADLPLRLQVDDELAAGRARLCSPAACVEVTLDAQWAALRQALRPAEAGDDR